MRSVIGELSVDGLPMVARVHRTIELGKAGPGGRLSLGCLVEETGCAVWRQVGFVLFFMCQVFSQDWCTFLMTS